MFRENLDISYIGNLSYLICVLKRPYFKTAVKYIQSLRDFTKKSGQLIASAGCSQKFGITQYFQALF